MRATAGTLSTTSFMTFINPSVHDHEEENWATTHSNNCYYVHTVNSVCHRDYSIKGTEIQIKMFDDRLVFETPGKLPGIVRTDNIRHTHFSRNPKIAEYLKAYDYVKEFGEGVDRMCRELSAIGTKEPHYHLVAFIMKASVWANVLGEGQESIPGDQIEGETTHKNYPKTTRKLPGNKTLILHLYRKRLSTSFFFIHMQDVKKSHLTWAHCQKMG